MQTQQGFFKAAPKAKTLSRGFGRGGVQSKLVAAARVAQHRLHLLQLQCGALAEFIGPAQSTTAHHPLGLRKHPIRRLPFVWGQTRHIDTGHPHIALGIAADVKRGAFYIDLV